MKKLSLLLGVFLVFILFGAINTASANEVNIPKVDFSIKASQSVIVKPQGQNAQGNLDVHLSPSGMSTNANRDPIDVVFIFDKSGSMDESVKGIKKIKSAKVAMIQAVNFFKSNAGPRDRFNGAATIAEINADKGKGTRTIGS